jgi:hypothetical protein
MLLKKGLRKPYQAQQASSRCVAVALLQHFSGYHLCCSCALSLLLYVLGSVCIVLCHFCFVFLSLSLLCRPLLICALHDLRGITAAGRTHVRAVPDLPYACAQGLLAASWFKGTLEDVLTLTVAGLAGCRPALTSP